jgi:hypothetical protein
MARGKMKDGFRWTDQKKIEVVTTYLTVGNAPMTEAITGVSRETIRHWKMAPWWKEIERELQDSENIELSAKLKKIVDKSIDVTLDRLEHGDTIFNPKTGELLRVPVKVREALRAIDSMVDKRQILQNKPTRITETRTIDDRLNKLAEEFKRFANAKEIVYAPEGEGLQSGIQDVSGETRTNQESSEA